MSKAFTKEDDADEPPVARPRTGGRRLLTPEGHTLALEELQRLRDAERPALLADGTVTGRERRRTVEARLAELTALLESAEVIQPAPDGSPVAFGAWVTTEDEAGQRATVQLVGPDEAAPRDGRVSVASPLGRALLGRVPGETVVVDRPLGASELTVVDVRSHR